MTQRRVAVRAIIFKDGKLLALTHRTEDGGETDYWATPGGGLDEGEALLDGLHREMIEETNIEPKIGKLLLVQQFTHGGREQLEFFFHVENAADYETIDLSATTHGLQEISRVDFIDPKAMPILPEFLRHVDIQACINGELPVYIANELLIPADS